MPHIKTSRIDGDHIIHTLHITESDYVRTLITDHDHRTFIWHDSVGNREEFRYEIVGYNKKGEPEWQSVVINSTIKLVVNEEKYHNRVSYMKASIKSLVDSF